MSNQKRGYVSDEKATEEYLNKMIKNAEKHGIKLNVVVYQTIIGHGYLLNGSNAFRDLPAVGMDLVDAATAVKRDIMDYLAEFPEPEAKIVVEKMKDGTFTRREE